MEFFSEGRKMVHSVPFRECLMKWNSSVPVRDSSVVRRHYIFLLEPWDVRELCIRKTADLFLQLWVSTFPLIFLFIHNHLTLRKWCYTPLQHECALDPIIPPVDFHFSNICHVTTRKLRLPQCIMGDDLHINKQTNIFIANHRRLLSQNN
jgi:hypothetical protein